MSEIWHVYLIRCADGSLYTGITTDIARRLAEHRAGKGAKYLKGRGPLALAYSRPIGDRATASREEARIKKLSKLQKEGLIAG